LRQIAIKLDLQTSYYEDILQLSLKNFKNRVESFSPRSLLEEDNNSAISMLERFRSKNTLRQLTIYKLRNCGANKPFSG